MKATFLSWMVSCLLCMTLSGCSHSSGVSAPITPIARLCRYDATLLSVEPARLHITAVCQGPRIEGFAAPAAETLPYFEHVKGPNGVLPWAKGLFRLPVPADHAHIEYEVDLESMATELDHFDTAQRLGRSIVAPASSWLLQPLPVTPAVPVILKVKTPEGIEFATGLARGPMEDLQPTYRLEAHEIETATYSVFGRYRHSFIRTDGADIELIFADGAIAAPDPTITRWVSDAARIVAHFYGRFPVEHALVTVLSVPNRRGVVFGKVLPESSPGIVLLVGERTEEAQLYEDWILVHELLHLGFPSFDGEGKWLDEGSATYFEPILRARAGWRREQDVWANFVRDMPQGLHAVTGTGLERARDYRGTYWGGAIVCLLADIRARAEGKPGLEQGFRAVLQAGGNASQVWSLKHTVHVLDDALGAPILHDLVNQHAFSGSPVDLHTIWAQLGVSSHRGQIELSDTAPLARLRQAVVFGGQKKQFLAQTRTPVTLPTHAN